MQLTDIFKVTYTGERERGEGKLILSLDILILHKWSISVSTLLESFK